MVTCSEEACSDDYIFHDMTIPAWDRDTMKYFTPFPECGGYGAGDWYIVGGESQVVGPICKSCVELRHELIESWFYRLKVSLIPTLHYQLFSNVQKRRKKSVSRNWNEMMHNRRYSTLASFPVLCTPAFVSRFISMAARQKLGWKGLGTRLTVHQWIPLECMIVG